MDNNIKKQPEINMKTTSQFINNTYDSLSYFDLYGNSVIIFIFITLFVFLVFSYCKVMQTKEAIADDWVNQRCKPQNIPFAGIITHPEGTTAFQYTSDNFQYCVQNILSNITGYALEPFQFMIKALTQIFDAIANAIQQIRDVINKLRNSIKAFAEDVMSRILNVMTPIQKMFIALMDTFQKIQGVMTGGLYTMLGSYYTLQALMGAILELIIKILVALVIIIVGLWILPFTWPAAASMTVVFLAIAIPMAIIIYFMTEVLHIKTSGIPKLRCFDRKTQFMLIDGKFKSIEELNPQDILIDGSIITAKIKVTAKDLDMYILNGIIVSESHVIKYNNQWIHVSDHPEAQKISGYTEPYLYCLNTSTKTIVLNEIIFTDWDEIYDDSLEFLLNYHSIQKTEDLSKKADCGFNKETKIKIIDGEKTIDKICIGEVLSTGGIVYGIVELTNNLGNEKLYNLLVSNEKFEIADVLHSDYNNNIDSILKLKKNII
jgi:ABC-type multidrug transport system fused ATPase/permease subunit